MAQLVARIDDRLVEQLDHLIEDGIVANRSDAVRIGLEEFVDAARRRQIGAQIAEAYRRRPQTDEELAGLDQATRSLIEEEAW
jgi:Arc/MetJ-type ribon-helix-helix transcriptional regulator